MLMNSQLAARDSIISSLRECFRRRISSPPPFFAAVVHRRL
jgi:hypothetical protein